MGKWAQHRPASEDEDVAFGGASIISMLATEENRASWLDAGAENILRTIIADKSASPIAQDCASDAIEQLFCLQAEESG